MRLAELNARLSRLTAEEDRRQICFLLISNLIDLDCLYKSREVIDANIGLAEQVLETMRARHREGIVLTSDITRYELQLADLQLERDRLDQRVGDLNYHIATALGYPGDTSPRAGG